jgi:acyl-coenzyme A thioesterase PaaI-like protein
MNRALQTEPPMNELPVASDEISNRRKAADAMRRLARELVTADVMDKAFEATAEAIDALIEPLTRAPRLTRHDGLHTRDAMPEPGTHPSFDRDPLIGLSNPIAPPLVRVDESTNVWKVTFGAAYEGHPGFVHGGFAGAVLDHVLGVTAATGGVASMTGTLTTRYLHPTPANKELVCRGEVERIEGRKVFCRGQLLDGDTAVVEAEGIFLRVAPDRHRG